jgi:hypothetical protein
VKKLLKERDVESGDRISDSELESSVATFLEVVTRLDQEVRDVASGQVRNDVEGRQLK